MNRDRAYYRYQKKQHVKRKLGILRRIGGEEYVRAWCRDRPGYLSKGKIHCSCPMCASKTNGSIYKSRGPVSSARSFCRIPTTNYRFGKKHYKWSELRTVSKMIQETKEFYQEGQ